MVVKKLLLASRDLLNPSLICKILLRIYYSPGSVVGAHNTVVSNIKKVPALMALI